MVSTNPPRGKWSGCQPGNQGLMYLAGPLPVFLFRAFPRFGRWASILGLFVMCVALAASSFATSVTQLIATQGVLYALGGCLAYWPCILYMDEWFARKKGLAYGIMWSGTGLAGVVLPLLMEHLLDARGFRTTLRLWSGLLFAVTAPLSWFVKPRVPVTVASSSETHARPSRSLRFVFSRLFVVHQAANIVEATGFFLPGIYLPLYAQASLGAGPVASALTILLLNVASVFGCVAMGHLVDRLPVTTCLLLSTAGAAGSALLLWGLATSLPVLYVFCVVYGFFAGSYTSAWPGIMKLVTARERERGFGADPSMVFGVLAAGRGIGNVISGPLSEAMVRELPWKGRAAAGYGSGFGSLIVFTGVTAAVGGASFVWNRVRQL